MNRSARHTTLLIEDDMEFPGFTTLKLIAEGESENRKLYPRAHLCLISKDHVPIAFD
jgi:hypothetical protein